MPCGDADAHRARGAALTLVLLQDVVVAHLPTATTISSHLADG
jgi:hypothetical protein